MKKLTLLSVAHFFVDFACAFVCLGDIGNMGNLQMYLLIYNFLAFAVQMPLGLLVDRFGHRLRVAGIGILLTLCAVLFDFSPLLYPWPTVILAGLGNALFHVGGGVHTLHRANGKCTPLGIFVAPGAFGLFLGGWCASSFGYILPVMIFVLACLAIALLCDKTKETDFVFSTDGFVLSKKAAVALILLFAVVFLRSAAGFQFGFSWKTGAAAVLFALAVTLGKALGGILADRFGMMNASAVSLVLSGILFGFAKGNAVCGVLAVLLFNCTMPVTLFLAAELLKHLKGFSFGLLTFALFLGLLPSYFGFSASGFAAVFGVGACAVSLVLLLPAVRLTQGERI